MGRIHAVVMFLLGCAASAAPAQQVLWTLDPPHSAGSHLARVGDIDGDGFDDLVIDVYPPLNQFNTIPSLWFFSGRHGQLLRQGMNLGSTQDALFSALVSAGDVDQDGLGDYAVAYHRNSTLLRYVEVRSAATDAVIWSVTRPITTGFGLFLAGDIDLNGDGRKDLVVSSLLVTGTPGVTGNGLIETFDHQGQLLHTVVPAPNELIGSIVANYIDYDGDGCDDYLNGVGEPSGRGAVDIMSGGTGQVLRRLWGHPGDLVGNSLSRAGDLDGDGVADVVAGHTSPFSPGVLNAIGSVSGQILHRWTGGPWITEFGRYVVADIDVDCDGVTDVLAGSYELTLNPFQDTRGPFFIFSGRDGSQVLRWFDPAGVTPNGVAYSRVVELTRAPGESFPRFLLWASGYNRRGRGYVFSGAPAAVRTVTGACAGTLLTDPRIGLRDYGANGFRIHLSQAEPGAGALLVLGFTAGAPPIVDAASTLGLGACTLLPVPLHLLFLVAGSSGIDAGYAFQHFAPPLAAGPAPGGLSFYAQWAVLGSGATWPGGLTEALYIRTR